MATRSSSTTIDLQEMLNGAAKLELKAWHAGVECLQVWIGQAARLSNIASETLQALQDNKGSLAETARRLTEFGRQNAEVFGDLSSRLSRSYYDELGRLTAAVDSKDEKAARESKPVRHAAPVRRASRRKLARRK